MKFNGIRIAALLLGATIAGGPALADELKVVEIKIENHTFQPSSVEVPANTLVKLLIENLDSTPEEFESYQLNREKIISGGETGTVYVGPLDPGTYPFFGEFNPDTAQGELIVK
ncbi:MAG: cupredoxin domain-containing protein [Alphaproteobacteria bacterium HGW-Alphaproteobacteria-12]|nr:MAG: cupredoxin domain-containing protein [Alphaproteobacteria bacterium HGW-Alphaproteobacteria-12]